MVESTKSVADCEVIKMVVGCVLEYLYGFVSDKATNADWRDSENKVIITLIFE
jgi:hypothetical protein